MEGRRRTRSAAKGVTATPPPVVPAKKKRKSSTSGSATPKGMTRATLSFVSRGKLIVLFFTGRGRPKRNAKDEESDSHDETKDGGGGGATTTEPEENSKNEAEEADGKTNDVAAVENNAHEAKDEGANNNAETPKVSGDVTIGLVRAATNVSWA